MRSAKPQEAGHGSHPQITVIRNQSGVQGVRAIPRLVARPANGVPNGDPAGAPSVPTYRLTDCPPLPRPGHVQQAPGYLLVTMVSCRAVAQRDLREWALNAGTQECRGTGSGAYRIAGGRAERGRLTLGRDNMIRKVAEPGVPGPSAVAVLPSVPTELSVIALC